MALGDPYILITEVKARLGDTQTTNNADWTRAADASSRSAEKYCNRQFNKATSATARQFYPTTRTLAFVDDFWTTSGLVIKLDQDGDGVFETTLTTSNYQLEPLNGVVDGESGWPYYCIRLIDGTWFPCYTRRPSIEVTAQWGWSAVPTPIAQAVLDATVEAFKANDGFFQPTIRIEENPRIAAMLRPYRRIAQLVG